jgi:hypothetical protein
MPVDRVVPPEWKVDQTLDEDFTPDPATVKAILPICCQPKSAGSTVGQQEVGRPVDNDGLGGSRSEPSQNLANISLAGTAATTVLNTAPAAGAAEPKVTT